jgi:5'-deoxynucleotidase YfbR-like HD superfamily hydrolase
MGKLNNNDHTKLFSGFVGREMDLRAVSRYSLYEIMLYRTNLWTHSHRVAALVRAINPVAVRVFGAAYDPRKAELMAHVHDDAEIIFGDIQAGNKSKMTAEQLQKIKAEEKRAIDVITKKLPKKVGGYSYSQLLTEMADHSSLEAQIVSYADKYDALGEALHEIFAGNHHFITRIENEYGQIPIPTEYYAKYFQDFADKFPATRQLLKQQHALFEPVENRDYSAVALVGKPHTERSIRELTPDPHYNNWRQLVLDNTNNEVRRDLYIQKEFLS